MGSDVISLTHPSVHLSIFVNNIQNYTASDKLMW